MILTGKVSEFGGAWDTGMKRAEGLSLAEHHEADKRPELFYPRSLDLTLGTSQRLIPTCFFFAYRHRIPAIGELRLELQQAKWRITFGSASLIACLIDWGPAESTGKDFDLSPGIYDALGLKDWNVVNVERLEA